jgi:CxxC motif-containing protein (DUF1111 family)
MKLQGKSHLSRISFVILTTLLITAAYILLARPFGAVKAATALGGPLPGLSSFEVHLFNRGLSSFERVADVVHGLGPVYTNTSCSACHGVPVAGGGSDFLRVAFFGTTNSDGSFNDLANEGGLLLQPDSVISFIPNCKLKGEKIPPDATIVAGRLTLPTFGSGLIDSIDDNDILAQAVPKALGVHGVVNMVPDEHGVTRVGRFGHKAQFVTLVQFSGHAMTDEMGVTNPLFPDEDLPQGQPIPPECNIAAEPNDDGTQLIGVYQFEALLAPNTPGSGNSNGHTLFHTVGCDLCHLQSYTTKADATIELDLNGNVISSRALSSQTAHLYSDLLLHDMGPGLADNIPQGQSTGSQWRTPPLWGLSVRTHYLHDGRTSDLTTAILMHGGEATQVISNFRGLSPSDQADLLAFIGSL